MSFFVGDFLLITCIGGDKRQIYLSELLQKDGYGVAIYGNDFAKQLNLVPTEDLKTATQNATVILLPYPCSKDKINIQAPFYTQNIPIADMLAACQNNAILLGGMLPKNITDFAVGENLRYYDYGQDEALQILNALPTAEEAIKIAIENTDYTLFGANVLICGYGRIGKILAKYLKTMGANVSVSARKEADIAWIEANGYTPLYTAEIKQEIEPYQIVFNTIPHIIFDEPTLQKCNPQVLLIDLASGGGIDFAVAQKLNLKAIHALSLPGKTAPKTSAYILYKTINRILKTISI